MINIRIYIMVCVLIPLGYACKHSFDPPTIPAKSRPLVVEGFINSGADATTTVSLTRVQDVSIADTLLPELHAVVFIEGQGGDKYPLLENGNGKYSADHLTLNAAQPYRLNISTSNGSTYVSDYVPVKQTPPIDSLEWDQNTDVNVYVNTHDPLDSTRYYRWDYVETWNYSSNLTSPWDVSNRIIFVKDTITLETDSCFRTDQSTDIVVGTTVALAHDVVSHQPVALVPINSEKISKRYSILVRQYALTKEAYQFHQTLQKNTQQTGSLFDPQPSQLPTNVHCTSNPNDIAIGFISASSVQEKRIFIKHNQVTDWTYIGSSVDCTPIFTSANANFLIFDYPDTTYGPYYFVSGGGLVLVKRSCTDCRYWGGTNVIPAFW